MKLERIKYPDILRIAAIFFVILAHITSVGLRDYAVGSVVWIWSGIFNSISHWAVPVFFMISGMFFLNPAKSFNIEKFYKKNIGRIVLCIVVWGFFYSLLDQYIYGTISAKSIIIAVYGIITGNTGYHLWFLYTLLVMYIATPALRIFTAHATKNQLDYALIVWFILSIAIGQVNTLAQELWGINNMLPYSAIIITGYGGYYLLGYRLKVYPLSDRALRLTCACAAVMIVIMSLASVLVSVKHDTWISGISAQLGIGQCVMATAVFSLAQKTKVKSGIVSLLGQQVFGIYLVHVFFVSLLFRIYDLKLDAFCPPLLILGYSVAIYALSLLVSWILTKIPGIKNIV